MILLKTNKNYIWLYFIIFYALWCIRELWLVQYLDMMDSIPKAIISAIIKIAIWVMPVIFLVGIMEKVNPLSYLGLYHNFKKGLKWAGWVSLVFIFYFVILNLTVLKNNIHLQMGLNEWLNTILLVGITEEIVFRGFLLRKLMDSYKFWIANTITALLFASIHFPIWFYKGLSFPHMLSSIITAIVLGIIFGFVYKKSNSLWSVILVHSLYNFLVSIFY